jgi:hypothetical protein
VNAVHGMDFSFILTCQNSAFKSKFKKYLLPCILLIHSCLFGILYASSIMLSFNLLLLIIIRDLPLTISEWFLTMNVADLCGLRLSLIAFNFNSSSICILKSSISFEVHSIGIVLII